MGSRKKLLLSSEVVVVVVTPHTHFHPPLSAREGQQQRQKNALKSARVFTLLPAPAPNGCNCISRNFWGAFSREFYEDQHFIKRRRSLRQSSSPHPTLRSRGLLGGNKTRMGIKLAAATCVCVSFANHCRTLQERRGNKSGDAAVKKSTNSRSDPSSRQKRRSEKKMSRLCACSSVRAYIYQPWTTTASPTIE